MPPDQNQDALSPEDSAALVHAQQQLYSTGDPRAAKLYNYIVQAGYATKGDNGELHPQGETKSFYDKYIKGTLSGDAGWQQGIDKAAQAPPVDTSSASGFVKSVGSDLGAGAVRLLSPAVHPINTAVGLAKAGKIAFDPMGSLETQQQMARPFVENPSGEAVAAIPQAVLAAAGAGEAQPAANAIERSGEGGGVVNAAASTTKSAAGKLLPSFLDTAPDSLITRAVKPGKNNAGWTQDVQSAIPQMKAAEQQLGKPIGGIDDALEAAKVAKQNIWQQVQRRLGPAAQQGAVIDGNQVADAMMGSIDKRMALQNPGLVDRIKAIADTYRRDIPVTEAEDFIQSNNKELTGYYAKNKISQQAAEADPEVAAKVTEGNALRDGLYQKIDDLSGPGVAQLKKTYGALTNVQKELTGRQIVYARQAPVSLGEQLGYLQAGGKILTGDIYGGVKDIAIRRFLSDVNDSNSMVARAFENAKAAAPFPEPVPVRIAGLLQRGPIQMPAPAEAGGTPAGYTPPAFSNTTRAQRLGLLLPEKSGAPSITPYDPGMSGGERAAAFLQELRRRRQALLPSRVSSIQLPPAR